MNRLDLTGNARKLCWAMALISGAAACGGPACHQLGGSNVNGLREVRNVVVSIRRPPSEVYRFISNGENVPRWAQGLGDTIRREGDEWVAEGPIGKVRVRFVPTNDLGVADHDVVLPNGETNHNPLRVIPNGSGSTVIFTLLRDPQRSEQDFNQDAQAVERDLQRLKQLLEQS
jgi:hypothetical protein